MILNQNNMEEIHKKIREILINEWDPIGIKNIQEAQDEYDNYIPQIYKLISSKKTLQELTEYLMWVENENMGLKSDADHAEVVAKSLFKLL